MGVSIRITTTIKIIDELISLFVMKWFLRKEVRIVVIIKIEIVEHYTYRL